MGKKTTTTWSNTILLFANNLLRAHIADDKYVICPVFGTKHDLIDTTCGYNVKKVVQYHGCKYFVQFVQRFNPEGNMRYVSAGIIFERPNYVVGRHVPIIMVSEDFSEQMFFDTNGVPSAENKNQTG